MVYNYRTIGIAPNGEELHAWEEEDGSLWEEYWQTVPGGGLVLTREV